MQLYDATNLIKDSVQTLLAEKWADLGCGTGTFTKALSGLLPEGSNIIAIDREPQTFHSAEIIFKQADFISDKLELNSLNGMLMANSFHFVQDKMALIKKLEQYFSGPPRFVFVEYDTEAANLWVPHPISFSGMQSLFGDLGYEVIKTGDRASSFGGRMYSALVQFTD